MNAALLSSKSMNWRTPQDFFDKLDAEFHFVLDAAANADDAKCARYFSPREDALQRSWDCGGAVFCNPPYGREIGKWVRKAAEEARGGIPYRDADTRAHGHKLFSQVRLRAGGDPLSARAAALFGRKGERRRSGAFSVHAGDLQRRRIT